MSVFFFGEVSSPVSFLVVCLLTADFRQSCLNSTSLLACYRRWLDLPTWHILFSMCFVLKPIHPSFLSSLNTKHTANIEEHLIFLIWVFKHINTSQIFSPDTVCLGLLCESGLEIPVKRSFFFHQLTCGFYFCRHTELCISCRFLLLQSLFCCSTYYLQCTTGLQGVMAGIHRPVFQMKSHQCKD